MADNETKIELTARNSTEVNKKMKERAIWGSPEMKKFRESVKRTFGFDPQDKKSLPAGMPGFSWKSFKEKIFRETNSASAQTQLLRAGVQVAVNNLYPAVKTTYEQWTHVIPSSRDTELYAPLNALTFLEELGEGERFPESSVSGLDIKLRNKKFGQMFPVSFELIDDDQTGQFAQKVSDMADYAAQLWEVYSYGKLASGTIPKYARLKVAASETKPSYESSYPFSTTGLKGGGINAGAPAALSQTTLQTAFTALENMLNLQGLKMAVNPDSIIVSPYYRWVLSTLLNSNFYPSGAAAAGNVGGALAINVLQGIANPVISRFVFDQNGSANSNSKAWFVADTSKPAFIVQMRENASIVQEDPTTGAGFERDIYRWKLRVRGNADFIEPRFFYRGSDGSA
jgi:phage major head subunit gpT-like protein